MRAQSGTSCAGSGSFSNFTNPRDLTEAVSRYSSEIIGLCNVPINMQHMIVGDVGGPESEVKTALCRAQPYGFGAKVLQGARDVTGKVMTCCATVGAVDEQH
ncbi:hypothetical protein LAD77_02275 [Klebsiella pneumoniae]|nr:hypothetical protein [Klebsiella pneumoniae]